MVSEWLLADTAAIVAWDVGGVCCQSWMEPEVGAPCCVLHLEFPADSSRPEC